MRVYLGYPLITVALFRFHCFMVMACLKLDGLGGWRGVCFCFVFVSWVSYVGTNFCPWTSGVVRVHKGKVGL